jgi:hypothetical protein
MPLEKKDLDKLRYYGGIGKRFVESLMEHLNEANEGEYGSEEAAAADEDSNHNNDKRMDKMKYFGGLGKRTAGGSSPKRMDKMKYFGGIGKRGGIQRQHEITPAKKSKNNLDKLRFMGNIGK